jgi:hypothetical protein
MIKKMSWKEFQETGLLWWINRGLHLFGVVIVIEVEDDGSVTDAYPARCSYRGFDTNTEENGFKSLTKFLEQESPRLQDDVK